MMSFGKVVGIVSDVHGADRTLRRALEICRAEGVESIALLGDLFDRVEQADPVVVVLAGWRVIGVYGNHERDVALAAAAGQVHVLPETEGLLSALRERVVVDDVCLVHEAAHWGHHDPMASLFGLAPATNGQRHDAWLTFAGHTHFRSARDERGPLDIGRGTLTLDATRRYLINPGALTAGQFAIWHRDERRVEFRHLEW